MSEIDERRASQLAKMARIDATWAAGIPPRIQRAYLMLDPELLNSPLRASSGGRSGTGGHSDPVGDAVDTVERWDPAELNATRHELERLILDRERNSQAIARLLNRHAPLPPDRAKLAGDNEIEGWCSNHLRHGARVPTATRHGKDRTRGIRGLCGWCRTIDDRFGTPPNAELIRLHDRGLDHRMSDSQVARTLSVDPPAPDRPTPSRSTDPASINPPPLDQPPLPQPTPPANGRTVESKRLAPGEQWT